MHSKGKLPFKQLIDESDDLIMITSTDLEKPDGPKIIYINQAIYKRTGYAPEELIGKTPRILQGPETNRETLGKIKEALLALKSIRVNLLNYKKDGSKFWLDINIIPIYDENGNLEYFAAIERDVTQYKHLQANLYHLASTDPLTGVFNRRRFFESAEEALLRIKRTKNNLFLLLVDIDNFKAINDSEGHLKGDDVLCAVANASKTICRATDHLCRYGGDEFLLLLHGISEKDVREKADVICKKINETSNPPITVSVGITLVEPEDTSIEQSIARADKALYEAKKRHKGHAWLVKDAED